MGYEFDEHVAIERETATRYAAELSEGWVVGAGVNGGYLLAVIGNAVRHTLPDKPDPIAVSAYYLSASTPGPATVCVDVRRDGGSVATVAADLRQGDAERITALATYGDLGRFGGDVRTTAVEPYLPPPDECVPNTMAPPELRKVAKLMDRFDMRFHPEHIGWAVGEPSGRGAPPTGVALRERRGPAP